MILLAVWLVFLVDATIPADLSAWGVRPRSAVGLVGIPLMPLLHAGLGHLLSNSPSLAILLFLLFRSRTHGTGIVVMITLLGGTLLWLIGRDSNHIGASGLIFGLTSYLILSGFLDKRPVPLMISIAVGFLYGGMLLFGLLPRWGGNTSWEGHLSGAAAGLLTAYLSKQWNRSETAPRRASI